MTHHDDHHHHNHGHSHSHTHNHNNDHCHENQDHSHSHELSFEQKLEKLISHWIDHNNSHKETFMTWAERAKQANLAAVAEAIEKAALAAEEVTKILQEGLQKLK